MNTLEGDLRLTGDLICNTLRPKNASVRNADVIPAAGITADKLQHQHAIGIRQAAGADVASKTEDVHIVYGASGAVTSVNVACSTKPTGTGVGTDKKFTVDVQSGNQSTGFATLLTAVVTIDQTIANRQVVAATLVGSPALAAGDTIRAIVTASGSTGTQGQGLVVTVTTREDAST